MPYKYDQGPLCPYLFFYIYISKKKRKTNKKNVFHKIYTALFVKINF